MSAHPIPEGHHTVTPYLIVKGAEQLLDFMKQAFAAEELMRTLRPDGSIAHAEARIGDSRVMVSEASGPWQPLPAALHLYVPEVDAAYGRALKAGGESLMEPADQFYGDRSGGVKDPFGLTWWISTRVENLPEEEIQRRAQRQTAPAG